jgi:hypothetical protein
VSVESFIAILSPGTEERADIESRIAIADSNTGLFGSDMVGTIGTKREYATALRTLHDIDSLLDTTSSGKGGFISSEKEGELSRSYQIPEKWLKKFPDLVTTKWGVKLIDLIEGTFILPTTGTMSDIVGVDPSEIPDIIPIRPEL